MVAYNVEHIDDVLVEPTDRFAGFDLMSPYVWREDDRYRILLRRVSNPLTPRGLTGEIWSGAGADGLTFVMDDAPAIAPGSSDLDAGGCEDPTVVLVDGGGYLIFYTGVDAARTQGSLMVAAGPDLQSLARKQVMLQAPPGRGNIKEATLAQSSGGDWRIFYEYAADDASRIGMASASTPQGPWTMLPDPFGIREQSWDNWHLSTGPILMIEGHDPVMFYNGATVDARWRIGWVSFSPDFSRVTARGLEPLLVPPPAVDRAATDIAFAASCIVEGGRISLYYSLEDRILRRALVGVYDAPHRSTEAQKQRGGPPRTG